MEVFRLSERILGFVGLYQPRDQLGTSSLIDIIKSLVVIVCPLALLVPSMAFLVLDATQFSEICDAISNIGGALIVLAGYIAMLSKKSKLNQIIFELEDHIIERKYSNVCRIWAPTHLLFSIHVTQAIRCMNRSFTNRPVITLCASASKYSSLSTEASLSSTRRR